jgi:hypothetical protein
MRRFLLLTTIGAALAGIAAPACAFQEQSVGGEATKPAAGALDLRMPGAGLSLPEPSAGKNTGIELRIPGVGSLGALPKLDLGLELLYGANDPSSTRPDDKSQPSDVQLRATIKHRF